MFVSDQLDLTHDPLDRPMELQLFDGKPTTTRPITKMHTSSITLNNSLQFPVHLLIMQLSEVTPIILGLPWLHNINPDITSASNPLTTPVRPELLAPQQHSQTTLANPLPLSKPWAHPWPFSPTSLVISIKAPTIPPIGSWTISDPDNVDQSSKPLDPDALNIKIIGLAPFARIIQDGTPAFQLHISLLLQN
ncbi:hypothetical protein C0993_006052 [Termitomyces sp. T159_Od127]|nr:hypothetical protein C0993_006052 [Termitomyces sp. T159_Od127]